MSDPWTFEQRLAAYRREGITKIVVMPGAQTHNRDDETGKTFGPVYGVLIHHTAGVGSGLKDVVYRGTGSLPGPLCHDFLAKDGTLYVVGHGRTNHAGTTTPAVRDAIIAEQTPAGQKRIGSETVDANDFLFGLEIENKGDGKDPYPAVQMDVAVKWAAAHCRHYEWGRNSVWGHGEITNRKIDPSLSMPTFRGRVADRLALNPPAPAPSVPTSSTTTSGAGMNYTSVAYTGGDLDLVAGQTRKVYFDAEYADDTGDHGSGGRSFLTNSEYTGTVSFIATAPLPPGVRVRLVRERSGYPDSAEPTSDLVSGTTRQSVSVTGTVAADWALSLEIVNDSAQLVTFSWVGLRVLSQVIG